VRTGFPPANTKHTLVFSPNIHLIGQKWNPRSPSFLLVATTPTHCNPACRTLPCACSHKPHVAASSGALLLLPCAHSSACDVDRWKRLSWRATSRPRSPWRAQLPPKSMWAHQVRWVIRSAQIQCGFGQDRPTQTRSSSSKGTKVLPLLSSLLSQSCDSDGDPYGTVVPTEFTAMQHPLVGQLGKVCRIRRRQLGNALASKPNTPSTIWEISRWMMLRHHLSISLSSWMCCW
jgi:hypothetical protein